MSEEKPLSLAAEFPLRDREAWLKRVSQVLGLRTVESLRTKTPEGIIIEPLYEAQPRPRARAVRSGAWQAFQRVDHPDAGKANTLALADLAGGATGLVLTVVGAAGARGFGLKSWDARTLSLALREVELHAIALRLDAGSNTIDAAKALDKVLSERSINPEHMKIAFGLNPAAAIARSGNTDGWQDLAERFAAAAASLSASYPGPFAEADGRPFHDAGAGDAQEIGLCLAVGLCYLRLLSDRMPEKVLAHAVGMTLSADQDVFLGIAKFRAARLLWKHMLSVCGLNGDMLGLHAETSWRMMTRRDPHTNLLRTLNAAFAAGLGGADSITVLPFTAAHGLPDAFARRLARNVHTILLEESGLARSADPGAGAGYVESLTTALAERAWSLFQSIEANGGIVAALQSGFVHDEIARTAEERRRRIAAGDQKIIGTTEFVLPEENAPAVLLTPGQSAEHT